MTSRTRTSIGNAGETSQQSDTSFTGTEYQVIDGETGETTFRAVDQTEIEDVKALTTSAPKVVAHPTAAQLEEYCNWTGKTDDAIQVNVNLSEMTLSTLVAFCALVHLGLGDTPDERVIAGSDWAKRRHLGTVKSKYVAANTVAALLGLDVSANDKVVAKRHRSRIDRDAAAIDGIYRHLDSQNLLDDRQALLAGGLNRAIAIIMENGGVETLAKDQRAYKPAETDEETGASYAAIELDRAKVDAICPEKAEEALARMPGANSGQVEIAVVAIENGQVKGHRTVFLPAAIRAKLLGSIAPVPRQIELLAQTLTLGQAVHEAKSTVLVNPKDDDRDGKAPRRTASRQVVLRADGSIMVSGILAPSRVVVRVEPTVAKSGKPVFPKPAGDLIVRTAGRRHLELNLLPDDRRRVFNAYVNTNRHAAENPNCPLTLACSTKAAKEGVPNTFYADLQRADTFPQQSLLVPDETTIATHAEGKVSKAILMDIAENRLSTIRREKAGSVTMRVLADGFTLECGKSKTVHGVPSKVKKTNNGAAVRININKSDFISVIEAISTLPLTSSVDFTIDFDKVLKLSFETWVGRFTVFVPTSTAGGERESRLFRHLDPVPWPEAEVVEVVSDTPDDETADE